MNFRIFSLLVLIATPSQNVFGQEQDYLWPTNASQHLTSTFGETRSAHFHSGLDIKTWGREGYEVYASKDGTVHKMAVSVRGYGKVIYLKHDDGSFTVYAHLQRLNDRFQSIVDSVRMLDYSFETEIFAEEMNLEVKQGDIIGYTGSTGIGPPHLHFETRYSDEKPFNALRTNLTVEDTIAPTMPALLVLPLSQETIIRGSKYPQVYYSKLNKEGVLDFGKIEANGPIGLTISTSDGANEVTNKYAVYELGFFSGEDTLFYEKLDEFYFRNDDLMFQDRVAANGASRKSYQTLFQKDGPKTPFYEIVSENSKIGPSDSNTTYTIIARDYYGNETKAVLEVVKSSPAATLIAEHPVKPLRDWYWTEDWATSNSTTLNFNSGDFGTLWNDSLNQQILKMPNDEFFITRVLPQPRQRIWSHDRKFRLHFPSDTFFDTVSVAVSHSTFQEYPYLQVLPPNAGVRNDIEIQYYLGDDEFDPNLKYYLFRFDRDRNRVTPVDSKQIGRTIYGYPSSLGEFLIMPDNDPAELSNPKIFKTTYGKWFFTISAIDHSGIDFERSSISVNGARGIVEYDYEEDLLIYHHPDFTPEKRNVVEITVTDKAGNSTTETLNVNQM